MIISVLHPEPVHYGVTCSDAIKLKGWKLKSWTTGGGCSYLILAFPYFCPPLKNFEGFFSADSLRAFDSRNRRHVLEERSLCQGKTKYHIVCLQKGCHFSAAVWSVSSLLTEPLCQKPVTGRDGKSTYILYLKWYGQHLHLLSGGYSLSHAPLFSPSHQVVAPAKLVQWFVRHLTAGGPSSNFNDEHFAYFKGKTYVFALKILSGRFPPKKQAS